MNTREAPPSEKMKLLKQEFDHLDLDHDSTLSKDELFRALDDMVIVV